MAKFGTYSWSQLQAPMKPCSWHFVIDLAYSVSDFKYSGFALFPEGVMLKPRYSSCVMRNRDLAGAPGLGPGVGDVPPRTVSK